MNKDIRNGKLTEIKDNSKDRRRLFTDYDSRGTDGTEESLLDFYQKRHRSESDEAQNTVYNKKLQGIDS